MVSNFAFKFNLYRCISGLLWTHRFTSVVWGLVVGGACVAQLPTSPTLFWGWFHMAEAGKNNIYAFILHIPCFVAYQAASERWPETFRFKVYMGGWEGWGRWGGKGTGLGAGAGAGAGFGAGAGVGLGAAAAAAADDHSGLLLVPLFLAMYPLCYMLTSRAVRAVFWVLISPSWWGCTS
jgi:hypothetical protein